MSVQVAVHETVFWQTLLVLCKRAFTAKGDLMQGPFDLDVGLKIPCPKCGAEISVDTRKATFEANPIGVLKCECGFSHDASGEGPLPHGWPSYLKTMHKGAKKP